ncbi:MAG: ferritin family protein [Dehalococcoidia bacterium]|nr:ferritin family protein [Dehalococcoidia bacterium]
MKDGQTAIIDALKYALRMELDGKKFYKLAARDSTNRVGQDLFSWLADQEELHYKRFEEIYAAIISEKGWPASSIKPPKPIRLGTLFSRLIKESAQPAGSKAEIGSADRAIDLEIRSRDYYRERSDKASSDSEKKFFQSISAEEQGHYLALVDYKEYISDPVDWFTRTEHHLLDGA